MNIMNINIGIFEGCPRGYCWSYNVRNIWGYWISGIFSIIVSSRYKSSQVQIFHFLGFLAGISRGCSGVIDEEGTRDCGCWRDIIKRGGTMGVVNCFGGLLH